MPEVVGRFRTPRLSAAPSSPVVGEVYYDTATNILYWWNGTAWISAAGSAGADLVYNGSFPANTPYTDGDIVVSNGTVYLCVRPTSAAPTPWAGPAPPAYGTSLPASPFDGQSAVLVDSATNPTYQWTFRYNASSSSAYKWEFIGGTAAFREVGAQEITTGSGAQQDLATVGPQFVVPRDGDYHVEISVRLDKASGAGWATGTAYILDNGVLANPVIQVYANVYNYNATPIPYVTGADRGRLTVLSGHTLKMIYAIHALDTAGQQVYFQRRRLTVTPVRVS